MIELVCVAEIHRVPITVVDRVVLFTPDVLDGHFFDELKSRPRKVVSNPHRKDLLSMCLVHWMWTFAAPQTNRAELLPNAGGIPAGLKMMGRDEASGVKLFGKPFETMISF